MRFVPGAFRDAIQVGGFEVGVSRGEVVVPMPRGIGRTVFPALLETGLLRCIAMAGGVPLHATAFTVGGAGVLALGASGGGKSTLASIALSAGGQVVSDDSLIAGLHQGTPVVTAWRRDLFLRKTTLKVLPPRLARAARRTRFVDGMRWVLRRGQLGERVVDAVAPNRLWVISVDRRLRQSRVARIPQAQIVAEIMKATSLVNFSARYPDQRTQLLATVVRLASSGDALRILLGRDLLEQPRATLDRLLGHDG